MEASDATLVRGFHQFEPDEGIRWTDGAATVPDVLLANLTGPCTLELILGGASRYPLFAEVSGMSAA